MVQLTPPPSLREMWFCSDRRSRSLPPPFFSLFLFKGRRDEACIRVDSLPPPFLSLFLRE